MDQVKAFIELTGILLAALALSGVCFAMLLRSYFFHQRDLLNPVTAFTAQKLMLMGLPPAFIPKLAVETYGVSETTLERVIWVHALYGVSFAVGYFSPFNPLRVGTARLLRSFSWPAGSGYARLNIRMSLVLTGALSFLVLILMSSGGTLWVTAPREAYLGHRTGFGMFWLLYQMSVVLLFMITLGRTARLRKPGLWMLLLVALFSGIMSLTGSKGAVLTILILAFVYSHFTIRRFSTPMLFGFSSIVVAFFALMLVAQSETGDMSVLSYFSEYASVSGLIMDVIEPQGHTLGQALISSLWYMVPRSLYPGKPFEYGLTLFHGQLFPGMAEQGHTPGALPWTVQYMDFGLWGVLVFGIVLGSFSRAIYLEFIRTHDMGTFILMMSFCFFPPLASGAPVLYIAMAAFLWIYLGKTGRNANRSAVAERAPRLRPLRQTKDQMS